MNDFDLIQFGPYEGKELISVPAEYLINLLKKGNITKDLEEYINENLDILEIEVKRKKSNEDDEYEISNY